MPRLRDPKPGTPLEVAARGFPCFFQKRRLRRVITGDIWAFLRHVSTEKLSSRQAAEATAFIEQAHDFFSAANNPRLSSRPLLYYYAFLNLAKVLLIHKGIVLPPALKHGISDPRANARSRLRFEGQIVKMAGRARDRSEFFPELILGLDSTAKLTQKSFKVLDLIGQVPAVHRTFSSVTGDGPNFCAVRSLNLLCGSSSVWVLLTLSKHDR